MSSKDMKEQDSPTRILEESILSGHIFSNYLFIGPEGSGRKEAATTLAKAVNCRDLKNGVACGKCPSCVKIDALSHPDVFYITSKNVSSSVGINQVRDFIVRSGLKPYEGRKKVFIIENAASMKTEAANAFLKTLEEPSESTIFILIALSEIELLPTIVSRCHILKFLPGKKTQEKDKISTEKRNALIDSLLDKSVDFADEISSYDDKSELKESFEVVLSFFRDMFIYKTTASDKNFFNTDREEDIKTFHKNYTKEELEKIMNKIINLRSYVEYNVSPKITIDVLVNEVKKQYA